MVARVVLQGSPRGRPKDLVIVEAEPSLVPDRCWLEDLSENLCHGSPVTAVGRARSTASSLPLRCNLFGSESLQSNHPQRAVRSHCNRAPASAPIFN